ncbi:hypothetical protein BC938DRAFT_484198 [Jimgerdemannia flammicorona]|uniref:Uncharacterized protein n=1 Tax=Jimgerdemannia flammicorona TaxID=994334 RepID=A0A433QAG6_9FUNG|nr:hypothetical protein BC938DRAFT_484198 [Jimgerdemannia flammicorona]
MAVPRVGVGVFVVYYPNGDDIEVAPKLRILIGKRKGNHGAGMLDGLGSNLTLLPYEPEKFELLIHYLRKLSSLALGHLEFGETFEECAARKHCESYDILV